MAVAEVNAVGSSANPMQGTYGGTGVNNGTKTVTLGGNLATSGAHPVTLTLTGSTSVTLPTSGTLVNSTVTSLPDLTTVGALASGSLTSGFTVVPPAIGGTGVDNAALTITLASGSSGDVLTSDSSGNATWEAPGASSISITGNSGGALTGDAFTFSGGSTGLAFAGSGATETLGGTLALANGGTNADLTASTNGMVYSTASALAILSTADNGVLVTSNSGVPSISATLPTAVQDNIVATGALAAGSLASGFTVVAPALGGTGVANGSGSTITLGGALITTGAHTLDVTVTADTSVTLPTSGTLVSSTVTSLPDLATVGALSSGSLASGFTVVSPALGGTGINNNALTITLASGATGDVLTSDSSGNATWAPPAAGAFKSYSAYILNPSGTASVSAQTGSWISSVSASGGTITINITGGTFANTPFAVGCCDNQGGAYFLQASKNSTWSNTVIYMVAVNTSDAAVNSSFYITVTGS